MTLSYAATPPDPTLTGSFWTETHKSLAERLKYVSIADFVYGLLNDLKSLATVRNIMIFIIAYLVLVRCLRYRRESCLRAKFGYFDRESLASMTNTEAQKILQILGSYEFPLMQSLSIEFGLFKVCS